jgi:hypothetical protein
MARSTTVEVMALKNFPYNDRGVFINNVVSMPKSDADRYIESGFAKVATADDKSRYNRRDMNARDK